MYPTKLWEGQLNYCTGCGVTAELSLQEIHSNDATPSPGASVYHTVYWYLVMVSCSFIVQ